jgi:hypothetical protein
LTCRKPILRFPPDSRPGEPLFLMPASAVNKHDERCVTYAWLSHRGLFGEVYRRLLPDYFDTMPPDSGVVIGSFIPTGEVLPGLSFPGDIDVLVIPYEGDELVLSRTLAIEIKVIRASFARQGKSPNQFGLSQAGALLDAGFPHAAVGHLIVSDQSPEDAWREISVTTVLDAASGACETPRPARHDMLPGDLLGRAYGRLMHNCPAPRLGYFPAYPHGIGIWFPEGAPASCNPRMRMDVLEGIYACYQRHHRHFLRTRRYPPPDPAAIVPLERRERLQLMVEKMRLDFP